MQQHLGWYLPAGDSHFRSFLGEHPNNFYQQQALDLALSHCGARSLVLDIGANIGLFAARFSTEFEKVVCFEPTTAVYDCLRKNCQHAANINIYKIGLGQHSSTATISLPAASQNCGAYSMVDFAQHDAALVSETVPVMKLDDLGLRPDLVKMDVQGFEPWVLQGALNTLRACAPVLMLEVEGTAVRGHIHGILKPLGYEPVAAVRHDQIWLKTGEPIDAYAASICQTLDQHGSNGTVPDAVPIDLDPEDWEFPSDLG
jgi:FkbM family methyltransferase